MRIVVITLLLLFILYVSFSKSKRKETFIISRIIRERVKCAKYNKKNNKILQDYLVQLTNKVDKLQYRLHRSTYHNKIKNKIDLLEKKYNKAYKWYRKNSVEEQKMAKEISKEMENELL